MQKMMIWQLCDHNPTINFVFYRHNVQKMQARDLGKEEFLEEARNNLLFSIQTPFSIPLQFFLHPELTKKYITGRYESKELKKGQGQGYAYFTIQSISSRFLNDLVENPEQTVTDLGLNPQDYDYQRFRLSGIKVNKKRVNPCPLLVINQKDYPGWIEQLKKELELNPDIIKSKRDIQPLLPQFDPSQRQIGTGVYVTPEIVKASLKETEPKEDASFDPEQYEKEAKEQDEEPLF